MIERGLDGFAAFSYGPLFRGSDRRVAGETADKLKAAALATKATAKVKALVTERVGKGVAWMPFHFSGWYQGADMRGKYPSGTDPIVLGECANTVTTYGFDPVTGMQETKCTLCQIRAT